jgi:hypothetical protein
MGNDHPVLTKTLQAVEGAVELTLAQFASATAGIFLESRRMIDAHCGVDKGNDDNGRVRSEYWSY